MQRREALRLLGGASVFSVLSTDWLAATLRAQVAEKSAGTLQTLTPPQNEIVVAMSELLIPATDTPGAKGAQVNEFIDLILSEWATEEEKKVFLAGLVETDRRTQELFGHGFAAASPAQQAAIVQGFDDELSVYRQGQSRQWTPFWEIKKVTPFFDQMRYMTVVGYYTSTIGQEKELKVEIIPGALHGCVPEEPEVKQ
jgi:Gluconate 2-dehydrogenase subunit 3